MSTYYIYDFENETANIDLSGCSLIIFAGCNTSNSNISLPDAAVAAGAQHAIGFNDTIAWQKANQWITSFFYHYYIEERTIEQSAQLAANDCDQSSGIGVGSYRIVSQ